MTPNYQSRLEVQAGAESESAAALRICETPEVGGIHIQIEKERVVLCVPSCVVSEVRMVEHVYRIDADFKLLRFGNPYALDQVYIQSQMGRPFDPSQPESADLSRSGIHEQHTAL